MEPLEFIITALILVATISLIAGFSAWLFVKFYLVKWELKQEDKYRSEYPLTPGEAFKD